MSESVSTDAVVPQAFADRAMASIMYLHRELAVEKDRSVWLYRTLMEREQALAELWAYVHALEERAGLAPPADPAVMPTPLSEPEPQSLEGLAVLAEAAADELERVSVVPDGDALAADVRAVATPEPAPAPTSAPQPSRADGWKVW